MEFGHIQWSAEHYQPASERTKRELFDAVVTKANQAENELPYPKVARLFSEDRLNSVCLKDWSPDGRYYDPPVSAEITFYENGKDGFDVRTSYEFLEGSEGLSLAKYVEMNPARSEETKQTERVAMELLSESMDNEGGFDRLLAFLDAVPEEQKQRWDEEKAREEKEWLDGRDFADQAGTSFVSESEALALLDMIRNANWDGDFRL